MAYLVSHRQLAFDMPEPPPPREVEDGEPRTHGGKRRGAGRKRQEGRTRANVAHRRRTAHHPDHPVHVTMRGRREVALFRSERVFRALRRAFAAAKGETFRIVHYSVQQDHLHLLVEAAHGDALRSGMQGLTTRLARAVNRALRRTGRVWGDRYHRRDLSKPAQVRNALVYVLQNGAKHGALPARDPRDPSSNLDPCSSAAYFIGWTARAGPRLLELGAALPALAAGGCPVAIPGTWLVREGWLLAGGRIDPAEVPAPTRRARP